MSKLFAGAQNLGKSFMLPIAVLPAAGSLRDSAAFSPIRLPSPPIQSSAVN
jgi:PTS system maltose and glucose-specific IIC component